MRSKTEGCILAESPFSPFEMFFIGVCRSWVQTLKWLGTQEVYFLSDFDEAESWGTYCSWNTIFALRGVYRWFLELLGQAQRFNFCPILIRLRTLGCLTAGIPFYPIKLFFIITFLFTLLTFYCRIKVLDLDFVVPKKYNMFTCKQV